MIGIASDHAGFEIKKEILEYVKELGYQVIDYGPSAAASVDYPLYAFKIAEAINNKGINKGILICKTGIGMSIACNKVAGIRCAKVDSVEEAELTRLHNDSNVLSLSSLKDVSELKNIVKTFLETSFSNEERHINRINMIESYKD